MIINSVANNQNFEGNIIVKNKLNKQNKALLAAHKFELENMVKDLPFNLYVKQSNNKKIITLSTNVEGTGVHQIFKRKQNFMEAANNVIAESMKKSEAYKKMVKANEILWHVKQQILYIITGKFKLAREIRKDIAKLGIKDFDIYKAMTNFKLKGFPPEMNKTILVNSIKYKIYSAFTKKTPEEKQLIKMNREYLKEMKAQGKEIKPVDLELPRIY